MSWILIEERDVLSEVNSLNIFLYFLKKRTLENYIWFWTWIFFFYQFNRIRSRFGLPRSLISQRTTKITYHYFLTIIFCFCAASCTPIYYKVWGISGWLSSFRPKCFRSCAKVEGPGWCKFLALLNPTTLMAINWKKSLGIW